MQDSDSAPSAVEPHWLDGEPTTTIDGPGSPPFKETGDLPGVEERGWYTTWATEVPGVQDSDHVSDAYEPPIPDLVEEPAPTPVPPAPDPGPMQALDPNLLDPLAPGPTLDTGLVGRIEGNPGLLNAVNQDQSVAEALERDPTQLDQIAQYLGVAEQRPMEPSGATDPSLTDSSLTEPPPPETGAPDQDADDITP